MGSLIPWLFLASTRRPREIRAISIPRDTRVEIPGHGTHKINAANAIGGPKLAEQVVQDLLGVPIDYYVDMTCSGLRGIVDLVGGVYIVVDENMHYTDRHQNLYINLKAGPQKQLLSGVQAEGYVRFRHDRIGDSGFTMLHGKKVPAGRTIRQQYFMRSLVNRILSMPTKRQRMEVLSTAYDRKYIISDLQFNDWQAMADYFKDIKPERIPMVLLPGAAGMKNSASYWIPDYEGIARAADTCLKFQGKMGEDTAKVEVLNGSGVVGMANKVADQLKKAGFEVTRTSNAPNFSYDQCCIITHKGKTEPVQRISKLLKCDDIREDVHQVGPADVTVIVGRNYSE